VLFGWSSGGNFVIDGGPAVMGLSVWDVVQIPTDPWLWRLGTLVASVDARPGLTVGI
jgi:hypothetical protein